MKLHFGQKLGISVRGHHVCYPKQFFAVSATVMNRLLILCLVTVLLSCEKRLTSDDEVYELMQFVIADQELNKTYGLQLASEENCNSDISDKEFLTDLIKDEIINDTPIDSGKFGLFIPIKFEIKLKKCLTQDDVDFMLNQKIENTNFQWNNTRLEFDSNNTKDWYVFSVPLFSKDKMKAVMMVQHLCEGLCGQGWTLLLTKEDDKWTSQKGSSWIH